MQLAEHTDIEAFIAPWSGPFGGTPPFDLATPASIERAYVVALARKRREVRAIATNPAAPTFENTVAALEDGGRSLCRIDCLFRVFAHTLNTGEMRAVEERLAPLASALEDEIAHDDALVARIRAVDAQKSVSGLSAEQQRLTKVLCDRLLRRGAGLDRAGKARLARINGHLADLYALFGQNLIAEQERNVVVLNAESDLTGLSQEVRAAAACAAEDLKLPGLWAVRISREAVRPFLSQSARRDLREQVWRMWVLRGERPGRYDNKPVVNEILKLRGEKATLLGFPSYAHFATADRMAQTPEQAMALMMRVWSRALEPTRAYLAELRALADTDCAGIELAPWDQLYYAEKRLQSRFALNEEDVKAYLELESIRNGMFWAAGQLHGLAFVERYDVSVCHPDVRVYAVSRADQPVGLIWFDLYGRAGKRAGGWMDEYRTAETFRGRVLPLVSINLNLARPGPGEPTLLTWEYARTLFHEFGHALHSLCSAVSYPTLGVNNVVWDFVELPSQLNERWLETDTMLSRFARHHRTGEPIPAELVAKIEQARLLDSASTLAYLATAIVDMKLHLEAGGHDIDVWSREQQILADLALPDAVDPRHRMTHLQHSFAEDRYAAGYYVYLWADVMVADIAEAFADAAGGFYDVATAERLRRTILSVGNSVAPEEAFRNFRGRPPDPDALLRRLQLEATA